MEEKQVDLSIVIPVYNHEKYIKHCISSVLKELPENSEIIIVDDGSTDNSIKIVEEFHNDSIKIYKNPKNMGCAYSLNKAILLAKGKYIGTTNSDDFVEDGFYKKMLNVAKKYDADVVCANIADYNESTKKIIYNKIDLQNLAINCGKQKIDLNAEEVQVNAEILLGHWTASSASTKIIKKEFFEKYEYIGSKANDITAIYPIMAEAKKIIYMPKVYMFYRSVQNSLSRRNTEEEYNSVIENIIQTMKRMEKINNSKEKIEILFFNNSLSYFINVLCPIRQPELRISSMKYFIQKLKEYNRTFFSDMKKSKYFKIFLEQYQLDEIIYDLLDEENVIDFLMRSKICSLERRNVFLEENNEILINFVNKNDMLMEKVAKLEEANRELEKQISNIYSSTSWKITKPIRAIKNLINKIRRRK